VAGVEVRTADPGDPTRLRVSVDGEAGAALAPVLGAVADAGATVAQVDIGEPTLEDVFIDLTGRGLR
jgi:ABC-2 type transport system ATP-binding protein